MARKKPLPLPTPRSSAWPSPPADRHPDVELPAGPQLHMEPRGRVKEPDLGVRAPLDAHLGSHVYVVDLGVEGPLRVRGQLVELLHYGELLCLQRVPPRSEQVQRLPVTEEDGLLALVDDELAAHVEVLDGVLPDKRLVVSLVLDDAGKAVALDLLAQKPLRHVVFKVAHGADICGRPPGDLQPHTALGAGELL